MVSANDLNCPMGEGSQQRSKQVTKKMLESSGTIRWRTGLTPGMAISHFGYRGGYILYEEDDRYTTVPMGCEEADITLSSCNMLFKLIEHMQARIDDNVERFHERKKEIGLCDEDGFFLDPIDQLSYEDDDPADIAVNMAVAEQVLRRAFHLMTKKQQKVWIRHRLQGYEFVELANALGISRQAVRDCFLKAQRIVDFVAEDYGLR